MDFNDIEQRNSYFASKLGADLAEAKQIQQQRYHLFDDERAIVLTLIDERKKRHLTQSQLAKDLGCARETIIRIEAGKQSPSLRMLLEMAKALGIGVSLLPRPDALEGSAC